MTDDCLILMCLRHKPTVAADDLTTMQNYEHARRLYEKALRDAYYIKNHVRSHPLVQNKEFSVSQMTDMLDESIAVLKNKKKEAYAEFCKLKNRIDGIDGEDMESVSIYHAPGSSGLQPPPVPRAGPTTTSASSNPIPGSSTAASTPAPIPPFSPSSSFGGNNQNTGGSFGAFGAPVPTPPPKNANATSNRFAALTSTAFSSQSSQTGSSFGGGCGLGGNNNGTSQASNPFAGLRTTTPTQSFGSSGVTFGGNNNNPPSSHGASDGGHNPGVMQVSNDLVENADLKNVTKEQLKGIASHVLRTKNSEDLKAWIRKAWKDRNLAGNANVMKNCGNATQELFVKAEFKSLSRHNGLPMSDAHKKKFWKTMAGEE